MMLYHLQEPEIWAPMYGYEGYYHVSTSGRIKRTCGVRKERIIKGWYSPAGYHEIKASKPGRLQNEQTHQMVAKTFLGNRRSEGLEIRHLNGNSKDNHLSNLMWGTSFENQEDRLKHGTSNRGERQGLSKLTEADVRYIKAHPIYRGSKAALARKFGVSPSTINDIYTGKNWFWLDDE